MPESKNNESKGQKRKISEMDIDEFMAHGFDSDVSTGDEKDEVNEKDIKKSESQLTNSETSKSKTQTHKDQLARLKEKDPEFYKFLQENDEDLLEFNDSETDDELQTDEGDEEKDDAHRLKNEEEETTEASRNEDDHYVEEERTTKKKGKLVTMAMIKTWSKGLQKNSLSSLRQTVLAFDCAVQDTLVTSEESEEDRTPKYRVEGSNVFNTLVQTCLKNVLSVIQHHLGIDPSKPTKAGRLPSANKKWSQVKTTVKLYLKSILQVLRKLSDPSMLCVVLRHTHALCPYYASFPKLTRAFIKRMVRMWSSGEEHVRVMSFVGVTKLLPLISTTLVDFAIKQLYINFVKNCKFTSVTNLPLIVFMQNSLVEIFSYNPSSTYQQGFVYIRQLAIHLRNAMVQRKKDSFQSVYNWQFIHCLRLWSRVLSEIPNKDALEPLIYPLVQVTLGVIRLNPTSRYYPLRFHCIRSLNLLSQATDTFIPVASFLLELFQTSLSVEYLRLSWRYGYDLILDGTEFNKPSKLSTAKPTSFSCILKVSKQQLHTKAFQDSVVDEVVELLLEHFSTHAHSIGFPELAFPCVVKMKHFVKTFKVARLGKQIKQLIEKLNETSEEVTKRRQTVTFSPKDVQEVEKWETEYRKQPNAIVQFYNRWKSMKASLPQQDEPEETVQDDESDNEEMKSPKKRSKTEAKQSKKKDHDIGTKHKRSNKNKQADREEKETGANDVDDIVEDFQFSDSDE